MKRPSVHQKLFWFYSIPVLVLMFLMLICCGLSIYNLNRQVTQLDQAALQNYADQLETNLNAIEMNVQTFTTVDNDTIYMQVSDIRDRACVCHNKGLSADGSGRDRVS